MRIYDLEKSLDEFVKRDDVQIEIIGEGGCWTVNVSRRIWNEVLQRYDYEMCSGGTYPDFLGVYDLIASTIYSHLTKRPPDLKPACPTCKDTGRVEYPCPNCRSSKAASSR